MSDFSFLQNPVSKQWVVLAPRRAKRPDEGTNFTPKCPFCIGNEQEEKELYRIGTADNWEVRVLPNKYPFAPIHEIIIHSPDHHKNFDELPLHAGEKIFQVYRSRYQTHAAAGSVFIFHNHGELGGESLPHPHSQLVVIPKHVQLDIPLLGSPDGEVQETAHFTIFSPSTSQWPDEVWVAPKSLEKTFGEITDDELRDLGSIVSRLIQIFDLRHGHEFPFNFYMYPYKNWYLRIVPRVKKLGGFEVGTNVFVNTQDPKETIAFIKTHFENPDMEKIRKEYTAEYTRSV